MKYSEHLNDPAYYEKMSILLEEIIKTRKAKAVEYEEYLNQIEKLAKDVQVGHGGKLPPTLNTPGRRALYNNLAENEELVIKIDTAVKQKHPDSWCKERTREMKVRQIVHEVLQDEGPEVLKNEGEVERIFLIIKQHGEEYDD